MNLKLYWSANAIQDLDRIYSYYSKGNKNAAVDLYNAIVDAIAIELLCSFSEMTPMELLLEKKQTVSGTYGQEVFQDYILYKESYDISCSCLGPPGKCKKTSETI